MRIFLRKAARRFVYKYTQHRPFDSGQYCSVFENEDKKRGQVTFLSAFVARPRLRSIDVRLCAKYEKKAACPLIFPYEIL
jgi:hypothetical protein